MEIQGFITRDGGAKSREQHWTGHQVKVITCHEGPKLKNWWDTFTHRGTSYRLEYFDGCFKPFVVRLEHQANRPSFV
jgi:hypothetical protein